METSVSICPDCGRRSDKNPEHFIAKCRVQHALRNIVYGVRSGVGRVSREIDELENFVNECCSHQEELKEEEDVQT